MFRNIAFNLCAAACLLIPLQGYAGLIGTELSVQVEYQQTSTSARFAAGTQVSSTVVDPGVEFLDLSTTQLSNPLNLTIIPVSVNAGNDYIEQDYLRTSGSFATGFFNGYRFTFDSSVLPEIV